MAACKKDVEKGLRVCPFIQSYNNQLDLDIRLSMSEPWIAKLAPEIAAAFTPSSDSFSSINFKLNGTLDRPTSNLIEKWATPAAAESPTPAAPLP